MLSLLFKLRKKDPRTSWVFMSYISFNFILGSIGNAGKIRFNEMTFVDDRDYPGGPNAYFVQQNSFWLDVLSYGVFIVNTWTQDGLLLYRFLVIFNFNYWVVAIPSLLYVVSVIMSCLLLAQIAKPDYTLFSHLSINFGLTYSSISIATTILVTILIVSRLLFMRYRLLKVLGPRQDSPYVSISAMFIESACLYSTVALIFIVTISHRNPAQNLVLPVLGQVQSISPLLIILRAVQGRAWKKDTLKPRCDARSTASHWRSPSSIGSGGYALSHLQLATKDRRNGKNTSTTFGIESMDIDLENTALPMVK